MRCFAAFLVGNLIREAAQLPLYMLWKTGTAHDHATARWLQVPAFPAQPGVDIDQGAQDSTAYAYKYYPKCVGFVPVMFGLLLQWPTAFTLAMFPVLVAMYVCLAH